MKTSFDQLHPNDIGVRVYTEQELEDWKDLQLFPNVAKNLEQKLVRGTCDPAQGCQLRSIPNAPTFSLERLVGDGLEAVETAITPTWWTQLQEAVQYLTPLGTVGGCAVCLYAAARVVQLGGQQVCPGGIAPRRRRRALPDVEEPVEELPLRPVQAQVVAIAPPAVPNRLRERLALLN